jgi:hypothetical protein
VLLFALGAWLGRSTADEGASAVKAAATESPTAVVTQPPPTVPPPPLRTLGGVLVTDLGQLVTVPGHVFDAVVNVDQREALAVVTLAGPGVVRFPGPYLRAVRNGSSVYGEGTGPFITVFAFPADMNTMLIPVDSVTNAVYAKNDALPRLLVWATETRGVAQDTSELRSFRATVDSSGELFVSVEPVSPALAINNRTGESLDLSHARRIGGLPPFTGATGCDPGDRCVVMWSGTGLPAPFDGVAGCWGGSTFEYDDPSGGVGIVFEPYNGSSRIACPSSPQALHAGDVLGGGWYTMRGMDAAGQPIALAVTGGGNLYAGDIVPKIGCPCVGFH